MRRYLPLVLLMALLLVGWWWSTAPKGDGQLGADQATVTWVPDGDTVRVRMADGHEELLRLIGVDAPENSPKGGYDCGGPEAAKGLQALLPEGTAVTLLEDPTQPDRDRFGRMLRYVETADGTDVGKSQIASGRAKSHAYGSEFRRIDDYELAEDDAISDNRGIWRDCQ